MSRVQLRRRPAWSLFLPRNLFPFLALLFLVAPQPSSAALAGDEAYRQGDFRAAEQALRQTVQERPADWKARHNLGLALAQQGRWSEATAQWTGAFLLNPRDPSVRFHLRLGLERTGFADRGLAAFSDGEGFAGFARMLSPGEWKVLRFSAVLMLAVAGAIGLFGLYSYAPLLPLKALFALVLVGAGSGALAQAGLSQYGILSDLQAAMVCEASTLLSVPTEALEEQESQPLSPGTIARLEHTFLGWVRLEFANGQTGWLRREHVVPLFH